MSELKKRFICADCEEEFVTNATRESLIEEAIERGLDLSKPVAVTCEDCYLKIEGRKANERSKVKSS